MVFNIPLQKDWSSKKWLLWKFSHKNGIDLKHGLKSWCFQSIKSHSVHSYWQWYEVWNLTKLNITRFLILHLFRIINYEIYQHVESQQKWQILLYINTLTIMNSIHFKQIKCNNCEQNHCNQKKIIKDSFKINFGPQLTRVFYTGANLVIIPKIYRKSNIFLSNNSTDHTYILTYLSHLDL